jgi:N-acetylmuramoyl-L-alanine amidase
MGFFSQAGFGRGWSITGAVVVGLCVASASAAKTRGPVVRPKADPWIEALRARQVFEAARTGTHTRVTYARVMDEFRAIYHGDPGDAHAGRAVEQVAELLAEEGRELGDAKTLRDAAGQYEFLAKAYPGVELAPLALGQALDLLGPEAANDKVEARKVRAELLNDYPRSAAARAAKVSGVGAVVAAKSAGTKTRVRTEVAATEVRGGPPGSESPDPGHPVVEGSIADSAVKPIAVSAKVSGGSASAGPVAMVTGIRHWSTATYTRVAIDLGADVQYEAARVENPDRIFFDLHHARLGPQLEGKSFAVTDDGFLTRIRAAQFSDDVTRVVLDVHEVTEYSAFLLPNPTRLIIDIHGKQGAVSSKQEAVADAVVPAPAVRPSDGGAVEVSGLPPMPVTDGSSGFGLPARTADGAAAARPRVVIASKPTVARPVPNTVATHSSETGTEVAAVSRQPGKVEATRRPTSQPIAERSKGLGIRDQGLGDGDDGDAAPVVVAKSDVPKSLKAAKGKKRAAAGPVEAAPPMADGETSLVRALGLKIGRIVIDAGHGGHDSGTLGADGIEEKDVVLDVALRLGKLLHDRLGSEIVYTRADDTFVPLETRTAIANKAQADLFVSIHANSSQDADVRGVEVYYLNFTSDPEAMRVAARENAVSTQSVHDLSNLVKKIALKDKIDESKELAADVDASLYAGLESGNEGMRNRGVKKAPFVVLIGANMPSILAEISFVTNPDDAEELRQGAYRERVAESLYKGIARYAEGINGGKVAAVETARAGR